MDLNNKIFNEFIKFRSLGEGGYADAWTDPEDNAHKDQKNITVRGLITPTFEYWTKRLGLHPPAGYNILEFQISMLRGENEPNANAVFEKKYPDGSVEKLKSETPLQPSFRKKDYLVPGLSTSEAKNPTNNLFKTIIYHQAGFDIMNKNLSPALQFIFANLYFAGGGMVLFDDDREVYTWAGGFKEWLKRNKGLKVTGKGNNGRIVTDEEAAELNANEGIVIDEIYDYAIYRFQRNDPVSWNTYKNGWTNAAKNIRNKAIELSQKKSTLAKTKVKAESFWNKHKKKIFVSLAILIILIAGYFIYKRFGKKKG